MHIVKNIVRSSNKVLLSNLHNVPTLLPPKITVAEKSPNRQKVRRRWLGRSGGVYTQPKSTEYSLDSRE